MIENGTGDVKAEVTLISKVNLKERDHLVAEKINIIDKH